MSPGNAGPILLFDIAVPTYLLVLYFVLQPIADKGRPTDPSAGDATDGQTT